MAELGSLGWWQVRSERVLGPGRRLARAFHSSYHHLVVHDSAASLCPLTDRDGRLREIVVSRLDMERSVHGARAWCLNNYANTDHPRIYAIIARRLPEEWVKSQKRRCFALKAFQELCENLPWHKDGAKNALAQKLNRSAASLDRDRLDFFLIAAAICLDDDAWEAAMQEGGDDTSGQNGIMA